MSEPNDASHISVNDRLKSGHGSFAVSSAEVKGVDTPTGRQTFVVFGFPDDPSTEPMRESSVSFGSLAGIKLDQGPLEERVQRIVEFAKDSGPLFGKGRMEHVEDWQCEIQIARTALLLQQAVNETSKIEPASSGVAKSVLIDDKSGERIFSLYQLTLPCRMGAGGALADMLPPMPFMRRCVPHKTIDYAFMELSENDGTLYLEISLVAFEAEPSLDDFALVLEYFNGSPELADAFLCERYATSSEREDARTRAAENPVAADANHLYVESDVDNEDAVYLKELVQAMISIHLRNVHIDLFQGQDRQDFLVFDEFVSYLWYRFSRRLDIVKVGYCCVCGKPFSLTNHRGLQKNFCSQKCRTELKNRNRKEQKDRSRKMYLAGRTPAEVASIVYGDKVKAAGVETVLYNLSSWPDLKKAIRAELDESGGTNSELLKRCYSDGVFSDQVTKQFVDASKKKRGRTPDACKRA